MSDHDDDLEARLARLRSATEEIRPRAGFEDRVLAEVLAAPATAPTPERSAPRWRPAAWAALAAAAIVLVWYVSREPPRDDVGAGPDRARPHEQLVPDAAPAAQPVEAGADAGADAAPPKRAIRRDAGPLLDAATTQLGATDAGPLAAAKAHYESGLRHYERGEYPEALSAMESAYDAGPNYRILYNIGIIRLEEGDTAGAIEALEQFLKQGGSDVPAPRRLEVERKLATLRGRPPERP